MASSFTLVQLRYFRTVARLENMTAAARELNVTQSTLSSAMAALERSMGTPLFVRAPRGLSLTPAGRRLLLECPALLEDADALASRIAGEGDGLTGELTVGIFSPLALSRAPILLKEFEQRHPNVSLTFLEGDQQQVQDAILQGRCELALMYHIGLGPGLATQFVERFPPNVAVPENHPRAREGSVNLADMADEPVVLLDLPHTRDYVLSLFDRVGITPRIRHRVSGYETIRSFVSMGHGFAVVNQLLPHSATYAGGSVALLPIREPLPPIDVMLVRPAQTRPTRRARAFEEICLELARRQ